MPFLSSVWYTRCPAPTPLSIAHQLGWVDRQFEASNVSVRSIRDSKDPAVRQSHFTHALDYSFRQGGNIPPIWARSGGRETRVVGITTTDEFQGIIALPSSDIRTGADLKGRRLGVPRKPNEKVVDFQRATALKGIVSALSLEGLSHADVDLIYLDSTEASLIERGNADFLGLKRRYPYGEELLALARGEIDAFFVKGAEGVLLANQTGAVVVSEFGFHPNAKIRINNGTPRPLTVDARFLDEHFDLVTDLVETVDRVAAWAGANPDDAVRLIASEIGVGEDSIWAANGPHVHKHLTLSLDDDQIAAFDHFKNFLLEWGFIPADFDVFAWIDRGPLEAARRRAAA
ncbi:ABC transporter substrate-binding protein [Agrobacterium rhizogenes]|uniref:ABC transporter substrate-binding protein n=1 Tax=Rhizobium rhizogenes TaxID=359 RepID=UPI001574D5FB|nr:ABC transporter substrate-binding protein [Rhizobium rhizogenes]NTF52923.1 ABC transporter substrate-binding protein [Rhizobium rhizogenes]NTH10133.1 ABC transporter substrate-binding protein [Rhizobium rhizogenes]NTH42685.1 ABC transporter substrate-binding protein [Rhizobium rhizogenes]NTI06692.1 ABC transporter substrate-binding protein [Rhizobium rhizogenes]NTI13497.1 ABC transporter substrate-binding protein [Rhizobium rhizogenes]